MLLYYLSRYTLHAENLELEALASWVGILDVREVLLVDLVHVHRETWSDVRG